MAKLSTLTANTALREAERFLYLHPHATTDVDNPVELLRDVTKEAEALEEKLEDLEANSTPDVVMHEISAELEQAQGKLERLIAFVRKLHGQQKICDLELREALAVTGR